MERNSTPEPGELSRVEIIKRRSRGLRGSIEESLATGTGPFEEADAQILKFHGIYQQDDRDERQRLKSEGKGKKYIFMIRTKNPGGGEITPDQWETLDRVADLCANRTIRLTTRADVQFHGVGKNALKAAIGLLDRAAVTTYGACGDGNRNTVACPVSGIDPSSICDGQVLARQISSLLSFRSNAYYEIWLDGEKVAPEMEEEPIYGAAYLPRKFKIAISADRENCVDVLTNDIGLVPMRQRQKLWGFTIFVGGGMGSTHKKQETFPRLAEPLGSAPSQKILEVVARIVEFQRDHGNRSDRTQARLKYVVERWGIGRVKDEIERRLGWRLEPPEPFPLAAADRHLGWHEQKQKGLWFLGIPIENGRIVDRPGRMLKSGLRQTIRKFRPGVRVTPWQDLVLAGIAEERIPAVSTSLADFGIPAADELTPLRRIAIACPALPTCGLAVAEAERFLPTLIRELEELGLASEEIDLRMSGCPNACSRPPTAEIGIVGRSRESYNIYLGGSPQGDRLAKLYEEAVPARDLAARLAVLISLYRTRKRTGERFCDFVWRLGIAELRRLTEDSARRRGAAEASLL